MITRLSIWTLVILLTCITAGCSSPEGMKPGEKREFVREMKSRTLQELYSERPEAKKKIEISAGYGVFKLVERRCRALGTLGLH